MVGFDCNRFPDLETNESLAALADGLKCGICLQVLNKAVDTRCGHTFCHECLNQWLSRPQTTKECPECRQSLTKRSRSETNDNNEVIIGGNVVVDRSFRINAMIGKLKIRCDYEWNGCPEVCPLESLSTHLKTCQHKLCLTCDLSVGPLSNDHNCIEGLKRNRNEWTQRAKELETKLKVSEEKSLNFDGLYKKMAHIYHDLWTSLNTPKVGVELVIRLQIIPKCLLFGKCLTNVGSIDFDEYGIYFNNVVPNGSQNKSIDKMKIPYRYIQCLYACVDHSLPMICIKSRDLPYYYINEHCYVITNSFINKCHFNVNSKDPSEHFIIIELNEAMNEIFVSQLRKKCYECNREFEYKTIDSKTAQQMLARAKSPRIDSTKS